MAFKVYAEKAALCHQMMKATNGISLFTDVRKSLRKVNLAQWFAKKIGLKQFLGSTDHTGAKSPQQNSIEFDF